MLVYQVASHQGSIFKIGQVEILVMPTMMSNENEGVLCHISQRAGLCAGVGIEFRPLGTAVE